MAFRISFEAVLDSSIDGVDADHIGPAVFNFDAVDGDCIRQRITLSASERTTLIPGELTGTLWWIVLNVGDPDVYGSLKIGFGMSDPITLDPGEISFWCGPEIPYAQGDQAAARIEYWAIKKA